MHTSALVATATDVQWLLQPRSRWPVAVHSISDVYITVQDGAADVYGGLPLVDMPQGLPDAKHWTFLFALANPRNRQLPCTRAGVGHCQDQTK